MIYRVYYENGWWGDEVARNKKEAVAKGKSLAAAHYTAVAKVLRVK